MNPYANLHTHPQRQPIAASPPPPGPGRRSPEPDVPVQPPPGEGDEIPDDDKHDHDPEKHRPGRDPLAVKRQAAQRHGRLLPAVLRRR